MAITASQAPILNRPLSESRCSEYQQLALATVHDTIDRYIALLKTHDRRVSRKSWRMVRRHEGFKIFRARRGSPRISSSTEGSLSSSTVSNTSNTSDTSSSNNNNTNSATTHESEWTPTANILCVGTLAGSIHDAMYGTITPTATAMLSRSLLLNDGLIDQCVLQDIVLPTNEEPFQYCGLKWAKGSSPLSSIVKPRDIVFVEASGFVNVPIKESVQRIGYVVYHSVDVPELDASPCKSLIRGLISRCTIFRQKTDNTVEVYATFMCDAGGNLPAQFVTLSAVSSMISESNVMACALSKKLAWLMATQGEDDNLCKSSVAVAKMNEGTWGCLHCRRELSSLSSVSSCGVCQSTACSRCVMKRELVLGSKDKGLKLTSVKVCLGCVTKAMHSIDSVEVAADEFVAVERFHAANIRRSSKRDDSTSDLWHTPTSDFTSSATSSQECSPRLHLTDLDALEEKHTSLEHNELPPPSAEVTRLCSDMEIDSDDESADHDDADVSDDGDVEVVAVAPVVLAETAQERLLRQMAALRVQAEQTYRYSSEQMRRLQRWKLEAEAQEQD